MKLSKIICGYKTKTGFWFRIFGRGISVDKKLTFSQRNGYKWYLPLFGYNLSFLPKTFDNQRLKKGVRVYVVDYSDWQYIITSYGSIIKWDDELGVYDIHVDKHHYKDNISGTSFYEDYGFKESHYACNVNIDK